MNSRNRPYQNPVLLSALLLLALFVSGSRLKAQDTDHYLKAKARMEAGHWQDALPYLDKALLEDGADAMIYVSLAKVKLQLGDQVSAITFLEQAESIESGSGSYQLARIYAMMNDPAKSTAWLEKHLRSGQKRAYEYIHNDVAFRDLESSQEWRNLWKKDWYTPNEVQLREIRYLMNSGESLNALEMLETVLKAEPDRQELQLARADLLRSMNQLQAAEQAYTQLLLGRKKTYIAYYGRAMTRISRNKFSAALEDLQSAFRLRPANLDLLKEMSRTAYQAGEDQLARQYIGQYLEYHDFSAEAWYLAGDIDRLTGRYLDALKKLNHCLNLDQSNPRYFAARGMTYLQTGTLTYAIKDLGMSLDLDPSDPEVWYQRGLARMNAGDADGAQADWRKAKRLGHLKAIQQLDQ